MSCWIILCGGQGSRLRPLTCAVNKHLLPVYDKPVIYYSVSLAILAGADEIVLICNGEDLEHYEKILKPFGSDGMPISFIVQDNPHGIVDGLRLGVLQATSEKITLILGDNIFFGANLIQLLSASHSELSEDISGICFTHRVRDPSLFGVVVRDQKGNPVRIIEKPSSAVSNEVVVGLYAFNRASLFEILPLVEMSSRGEFEISTLLNILLDRLRLSVTELGRGTSWWDIGSYGDLLDASVFIRQIQDRANTLIGSPEEAMVRTGYWDLNRLSDHAKSLPSNDYRQALVSLYPTIC